MICTQCNYKFSLLDNIAWGTPPGPPALPRQCSGLFLILLFLSILCAICAFIISSTNILVIAISLTAMTIFSCGFTICYYLSWKYSSSGMLFIDSENRMTGGQCPKCFHKNKVTFWSM